MIDRCLLTRVTLVSLVMASSYSIGASGADYQTVKPGCPNECGGVKIPYPFGFQEGCYALNTSFRIICDNSSAKPVPLLYGKNLTVMSISLEDQTLRISSKVAYQCYNDGHPLASITDVSSYDINMAGRFNMSGTRNMLVGIGCDTVATALDNSTGTTGDTVGCITSCSSPEQATSGPCPGGRGCCASTIFNTMWTPTITAASVSNHTRVGPNDNNCSVAFLTEANNGSYDFSAATLKASAADYEKMRVPVVYDWYVNSFGENCSESMKTINGTYAYLCSSKSRCLDYGPYQYRCQCLEGYAGNPYLSDGCQDINECLNDTLNVCETQAHCENTLGGYNCKCPNGFQGNATKASPCIATPSATKALTIGLSISLGSILAFIFVGVLYKLLKRRKEIKERESNFDKNGGKLLDKRLLTSDSGIGGTKIFSKAELEKATDNFNDNRVLGRGGQGTVYKGMMPDGSIVAIKKSKNSDENHDQSIDQFINEVVIMSNINHRHVVKLYGCCLETKVPLLVYEFVPNGTLEQHIHNPTEDFRITWKMRFQIAVDSAAALAYLHSSSDTPTYHRDIKSSNILLDEKYKAKVSDFGISKNFSMDQTHVTTAVQGTYGYLDPEYYQLGQFTDKSDVYSFGAVLLELLTSKRPISTNKAYQSQSLISVFLQLTTSGSSDELYHILDTDVLLECPKKDTETLVKLTKRCLNMHASERPTMKEVAMILEMIKARDDQVDNASFAQSMKRPDGYVWSTDQIQIIMADGGPSTNSSNTFSSLI